MDRKLKQPYFSKFYGIPVRKQIVREFTRPDGTVEDFMAGLHEIRLKMGEKLLKDLSSEKSSAITGG